MNKRSAIELIFGVLLIICSVFVFNKPITAFLILGYAVGIVAVLKGIQLIYLYFKTKDTVLFRANTFLVIGILLTILGIIFLFRPMFANGVFAYLLAFWFIYDSINNFLSMHILKGIHIGLYILAIAANIILLIGGICIIINPLVAAISLEFFVGLTFLVSGIEYIIFAITGRDKDIMNGVSFRNLK